jgi:hypothetical protein
MIIDCCSAYTRTRPHTEFSNVVVWRLHIHALTCLIRQSVSQSVGQEQYTDRKKLSSILFLCLSCFSNSYVSIGDQSDGLLMFFKNVLRTYFGLFVIFYFLHMKYGKVLVSLSKNQYFFLQILTFHTILYLKNIFKAKNEIPSVTCRRPPAYA